MYDREGEAGGACGGKEERSDGGWGGGGGPEEVIRVWRMMRIFVGDGTASWACGVRDILMILPGDVSSGHDSGR